MREQEQGGKRRNTTAERAATQGPTTRMLRRKGELMLARHGVLLVPCHACRCCDDTCSGLTSAVQLSEPATHAWAGPSAGVGVIGLWPCKGGPVGQLHMYGSQDV